MQQWQVQQSEARRNDILPNAQGPGPQDITVLGRAIAVIRAMEGYERLCGAKTPFVAFMRASPLAGAALDLERSTTPMRDAWSA